VKKPKPLTNMQLFVKPA